MKPIVVLVALLFSPSRKPMSRRPRRTLGSSRTWRAAANAGFRTISSTAKWRSRLRASIHTTAPPWRANTPPTRPAVTAANGLRRW